MRVTIKDVASKVNLSKAAVSLVLNGKGGRLAKDTQALILKTAKDMGYRPNKIARSLSGSRTKTIGLIIPDIRNAFFSDIAKGVEDEAYSLGYNVFFCTSDNDSAKETHHIKALVDWGVDGIVFDMAADESDRGASAFKLLGGVNVPTVLVDRNISQTEYNSVMLDNEKGAYDATNCLIKLGHRHIGCIAGALWLDCDRERLNGYTKALHDARIPFSGDFVVEAGYQFEGGERACAALLEKGISAVFAFNDLMAYGAVAAIGEKGLDVPSDVSVVGFDDIFFSHLKGSSLTTVVQPAYEMGRKALVALIEGMENPGSRKCFVFQPSLSVRGTTAEINR
jgi:LacI family transcriptional regulator